MGEGKRKQQLERAWFAIQMGIVNRVITDVKHGSANPLGLKNRFYINDLDITDDVAYYIRVGRAYIHGDMVVACAPGEMPRFIDEAAKIPVTAWKPMAWSDHWSEPVLLSPLTHQKDSIT
jgi:hypothetical protein